MSAGREFQTAGADSPGAEGVNLDPTDKVFSLQILVAQLVPIENPVDDIASPLGISSNMLIEAAITNISFLAYSPQLSMLATKKSIYTHVFMVKKSN